jgi:stringent starvation protein B
LSEIPTKPYLLRALFEWCVDNGYTPHLAVKVDSRTQVPLEYVKNGEITLNISPNAVHKLQMGNELIEFSGALRRRGAPARGADRERLRAVRPRDRARHDFDVDGAKGGLQTKAESEPVREPKHPALKPPAQLPVPTATSPEPPKKPSGGKPTLRRIK